METNTKPLTEEDCNDSLRIKSEEDLLRADPWSGEKKYDFVDEWAVADFKDETLQFKLAIDFAIGEMYRLKIQRRTFGYFSSINDILNLKLNEYIETIRHLHRKVYNTIYKNYTDEIVRIFINNVQKPLDQLKRIGFCIKNQDMSALPEAEAAYAEPSLAIAFHTICLPDEWIDNMPDGPMKYRVVETIMSNLTRTAEAIRTIYESMLALNACRREHSEEAIIYSYLKSLFDETRKEDILAKFSEQQDRYRKDRQQQLNSQYLTRLLDETEQEYSQHPLCRMWHEWGCAASIEDFAHACVKEQLPKDDFDLLFEYQVKCEMIKGMIADVRNSEQGRDPLFAAWVDPIKLERYLQAWIEVKVTTQQKWYVVWCLMKYTFGIIRPEAKKQDFAERMGFMFPYAPNKCVVESFRKQETTMNHNCHFSKWLKTDPDYDMAKDLYGKLENKERYKREETDL